MRFGRPQRPLRFWPESKRSLVRRLLFAARPFALAGVLGGVGIGYDPALVDPPELLSTEPKLVSETFTICGRGRSNACVVDGDTFRLGGRRVRIIGIDAPETHPPRCAEEARLGEQATAKLRDLLNQGPFEMVAPVYGRQDRYGRDLRTVRRTLAGGSTQSIAEAMRESGLARRYLGGLRSGWC
jgi:micrococcal nuclease